MLLKSIDEGIDEGINEGIDEDRIQTTLPANMRIDYPDAVEKPRKLHQKCNGYCYGWRQQMLWWICGDRLLDMKQQDHRSQKLSPKDYRRKTIPMQPQASHQYRQNPWRNDSAKESILDMVKTAVLKNKESLTKARHLLRSILTGNVNSRKLRFARAQESWRQIYWRQIY